MVNVSRLRGKIVECNTTQDALASELGMNRSTLYRKMRQNGNSFTVEEVQKIISLLSLSNEDVLDIFFTL